MTDARTTPPEAPTAAPGRGRSAEPGRWSPPGFLDAASGLPLHPAARAALAAVGDDGWADPARPYAAGRRSRRLLDTARESVAAVLAARPDEVWFTSSGTAAIHLAVGGLALGRARAGRDIVVSAVEHSAVLHAARHVPDARVAEVGVHPSGAIRLDLLAAALDRPGVAFAAVQSANHEVGTVQPVAEVVGRCRTVEVPLLMDAAASLGHDAVPAGWDVLTASAHKWGGPVGVGLLAVRTGVRWRAPGPADGRGPVPGFPTVAAAVAAAAALEAVTADRAALAARRRQLIDRIRAELPRRIPDVVVVGDPRDRLPHLVTFSCLYVDGEAVLSALDRAGFAVSSGSACVADTLTPSHVLAAMGELTQGNVRVSLPYDVDEADVERFLTVLAQAVGEIRSDAGVVGL